MTVMLRPIRCDTENETPTSKLYIVCGSSHTANVSQLFIPSLHAPILTFAQEVHTLSDTPASVLGCLQTRPQVRLLVFPRAG
jgi:hypothetical protein